MRADLYIGLIQLCALSSNLSHDFLPKVYIFFDACVISYIIMLDSVQQNHHSGSFSSFIFRELYQMVLTHPKLDYPS